MHNIVKLKRTNNLNTKTPKALLNKFLFLGV